MGASSSEWKTTERIFDMMKYLCRARYTSMPKLAEMYGVSVRTIKRDVDVLGTLIPIETRSGRYEGGVYVMDGYRWDKAYMSAEDIELLAEIKKVGEKQERLILNQDALARLTRIITTYSVPQ